MKSISFVHVKKITEFLTSVNWEDLATTLNCIAFFSAYGQLETMEGNL